MFSTTCRFITALCSCEIRVKDAVAESPVDANFPFQNSFCTNGPRGVIVSALGYEPRGYGCFNNGNQTVDKMIRSYVRKSSQHKWSKDDMAAAIGAVRDKCL
ncbi:unnamed protein product [Timema podura]|uniref:Rap1a immunity protein domain-containing protein n=1 Tax=Timema podura TaxID=61482 RepID=A0ABN7NZH6_TIMPD|nr:unnamed protein product [Timema podura]